MRRAPWTTAALLTLCACSKSVLPGGAVPDAGGVGATDDAAGPGRVGCSGQTLGTVDKVDVLFVIDNSQSMEQEQKNLALQLPRLASSLASGKLTTLGPDGTPVETTFAAAKSIHLGVVTTDMGANGVEELPHGSTTRCGTAGPTESTFGDDAVLIAAPRAPGCAVAGNASYLSFEAGMGDAAALGRDFACLSQVGIEGCGFEQQLEAAWKALAPSSELSFSRGTGGHGDARNAGFLRPDSVLAVVVVSDEEDCSIPDESRVLFSPADQKAQLNISCLLNPTALHPVARYTKGLRSLRPDNPDLVIFAAIVGVPIAIEGLQKDGIQDFEAILAHPEMAFRMAPPSSTGAVLAVPACQTQDGVAYPGRRFVETAKAFGQNGIVRSICSQDFSFAINSVSSAIAKRLGTPVIPDCD